jgi:hypothetical protein
MQLLIEGKDTGQVCSGLLKKTRYDSHLESEGNTKKTEYIRCPVEGSNPRPNKHEAWTESTDKKQNWHKSDPN